MRNTLSEFLADRRIILGRADNAVVLIHREALVGNRLFQRVVRLLGEALLIGRRCFRDLALVVLPDAGHVPSGSRSRVQLLVRNGRRRGLCLGGSCLRGLCLRGLRLRASLRRGHLGICRRQQKEPGGAQRGGCKSPRQTPSGRVVFGAVHMLSPLSGVLSKPTGLLVQSWRPIEGSIFGGTSSRPVTKMTHRRWPLGDRSGAISDPTTSECSICDVALATRAHALNYLSGVSQSAVTRGEMCRCGSSWPVPSDPLEACSCCGLPA